MKKNHLLVKFNWRLCQKLKVIEAISYSACEATSNSACTINIDSSEPGKFSHDADTVSSTQPRTMRY